MTNLNQDGEKPGPRRRFLQALGAGSVLGVVPGCGSGGSPPAPFGDVPAGNVSAFAVGAVQAVPGAPAIIARDAGGLYAMTSTCTHEGCDMKTNGSISPAAIVCSCHDSRFDVTGKHISGPANTPLEHFEVTVDASGNITIRGANLVAATDRLAV